MMITATVVTFWVLVQGCKAVICMPVTTPEIKIEAVRRLGGHVKLVGETYSETQTYAQVQKCANGCLDSCTHLVMHAIQASPSHFHAVLHDCMW